MNIVEPIFIRCGSDPAEVALAAPGTEFNIVSYARLQRMVNGVSNYALSAGLVGGNRVAVFIDDPIFHAVILIALTRSGIVTVSGRNKNFSWRFTVDAVIADQPFPFPATRVILADSKWVTSNDRPIDRKLIYNAAPDDLCRIFLTSGTTGEEKAIAVTHGMLAERIARQYMHFGPTISFSSRIYMDLGLTTSLGFQLLIATLWRGGALFVTGEPQSTVNAIPIYGIQSMIIAPGGLMEFLDAVERRPQYDGRFEAIWTGGSSVPAALSERARMRICSDLTIAYGSTEATMVSSMPAQFGAGVAGAVGYVFPGISVEIVGQGGSPLPAGQEGIVRIQSRFGAKEYFGDPIESARVFRDGWFYPGDNGYLTRDNMLVISGRSNAVVNVGGEKISPEKIEEILLDHPFVAQAAAFALPGDLDMPQIYALVILRSNVPDDELRAHCLDRLPRQLVPTKFIPVRDIPRNDSGKIERHKLAAVIKDKLN